MEKPKKKMTALYAMTIKDLVSKVNSKGIQKEDIVDIVKRDDTVILLYYESANP